MADTAESFLASWQQLSIDDRKKGVAAFTKELQVEQATSKELTATGCPSTVFSGIQLSSYYITFYYYPTMHWTLDRTPDDDTYWVGIFQVNASDKDYISYQYIKKTAQGSYKIGKVTKTIASHELFDEYELRIFKGSQRLKAETNKLRGVVNIALTDPFASNSSELLTVLASIKPDAETLDFIRAIENPATAVRGDFSLEDLCGQWNSIAPHQQQMLLPILEQSCLPDAITQAGPKHLDWPEPKIRFADIGLMEAADNTDIRLMEAANIGPDKIVLTVTLDYAYTYVYPQVYVQQEIPKPKAWMGMYYPRSDTCFDPDSKIDSDWAWVGTGYGGRTTKLNYIEEYAEGPTNTLYLGAIFDDRTQIGLAASTIEAGISATPALPPATFKPDFIVDQALRYAELSQLAYQPYSEVQNQLFKFNLVAEMEIHDSSTDTNGFIASNDKSVVVAFRGTKSFTNMLTDMKFVRKRIDSDGQSFAHGGFVTALNAVYSAIENKILGDIGKKMLFITGHSLGGALATLTTYRISRKYDTAQPIQFIYGCPPVGDINLANYFKGMDSNTITIQNDPVSTGTLVSLGPWAGLYKPYEVKYLQKAAGHGIADYIEQLKKLQD